MINKMKHKSMKYIMKILIQENGNQVKEKQTKI